MKKFMNVFFVTLLFILFLVPVQIEAASVSITGPSSMVVGNNSSINITSNAPGGMFQGSVQVISGTSVSVSRVGDIIMEVGIDETQASPSMSIGLTAKSAGTTTVRVNVRGEDLDGNTFSGDKTFVINVSDPAPKPAAPKPAPKPAAPKPSPKPSAPQKTEEELRKEAEARKKAEEEAKKREEEARKREEEEKKEKEKKTPLFSSFDIISQSDKRFGEVLDTVPTKFNVFEYEFQLPKNIDRFTLDFEKIADGVILDFEKEHQFTEDQKEIVVPVKASKGDINQNFSIKVKKDNTPVIKRKVDDKEMTVFDDELLDGFLEKYGFDRKTVGEAKDQSFYFEKGQLRLQLLIDDKFNGQWYLLDEKNELLHPVTLLKLEKDLLVTFKAPEEYHQKTIDEERYEKRDMETDRSYYEIYENLNVNQSYHSWLVEGGEIVYAMDSSGEEGLYYVSALKDDMYHVEKAFVGFDSMDTKTQKFAMVSGFGFLGLASANAANYYKKKRRRV